jgi:RNA polymerase sigma-70 factor (ECF subfamily)
VEYQRLGTEALIQSCVGNHNPEAWVEFVRRYNSVIALSVLRNVRRWQNPADSLVDDLVQETFLKLCRDECRILKDFQVKSEDSLYAFLKVVAANVVRDYFKAETAAKHGGTLQPIPSEKIEISVASTAAPEAEMNRQVLLEQIESHLDQCVRGPHSQRDKQIFWFYYRHGYTAEAIAALPNIGLKIKGVESTLHRLAMQLRHRLVQKQSFKGKGAGSSL